MNQAVLRLIQTLKCLPIESPMWEETCSSVIKHILKRRKICRVRQDSDLEGVYLDVLDAVQDRLRSLIRDAHCQQSLGHPTVEQWCDSLRETAFQEILTTDHLQAFALRVQSHIPKTVAWSNTLDELVNALEISNSLTQRASLNSRSSISLTPDTYEDAKQQTFIWIAEHIQTYSAEKCPFIAWVNERLKWIAVESRQTKKDPFSRKAGRKVRSLKSSLKANLERTNLVVVMNWLGLYLRKLISIEAIANHVLGVLSGMLSLWQSLKQKKTPNEIDQFLYDLALQIIDTPTHVINFGDQVSLDNDLGGNQNWPIDQVASAPKPPMELLLRQCLLKADPDPFDQHIRQHPNATFRAIALALLNDQKWKDIATSFQIANHSTVSNFYYRRLDQFAPLLKELVENELALWSLQYSDETSLP